MAGGIHIDAALSRSALPFARARPKIPGMSPSRPRVEDAAMLQFIERGRSRFRAENSRLS
jgi:hypothetical protein